MECQFQEKKARSFIRRALNLCRGRSDVPASELCYNQHRRNWRYRLGVRTEDSQSSNPGSIPGSATNYIPLRPAKSAGCFCPKIVLTPANRNSRSQWYTKWYTRSFRFHRILIDVSRGRNCYRVASGAVCWASGAVLGSNSRFILLATGVMVGCPPRESSRAVAAASFTSRASRCTHTGVYASATQMIWVNS